MAWGLHIAGVHTGSTGSPSPICAPDFGAALFIRSPHFLYRMTTTWETFSAKCDTDMQNLTKFALEFESCNVFSVFYQLILQENGGLEKRNWKNNRVVTLG